MQCGSTACVYNIYMYLSSPYTHATLTDQSYPWEVLQFLKKLGSKWVEFAKFIGFKQDEVEKLLDIAPKNTIKQIQNFSKVWRMPDLTSRKNDDVLDEVLKKARITTGTCIYSLHVHLQCTQTHCSVHEDRVRTAS